MDSIRTRRADGIDDTALWGIVRQSATFGGNTGNDTIVGTSANDTFNLESGGDDTVSGVGGNDLFRLGGALTAADRLDGGAGIDTLNLKGDYSTPLVFGASTATNFERLAIVSGFTYDLTLNAAFAGSDTLDISVYGSKATTFRIDASAIASNISFNSPLLGGTFIGGSGNDQVNTFTVLAKDRWDGGAGSNTAFFSGAAGDVVIGDGQVTNFQTLVYATKFRTHLTLNAEFAGAGNTLTVTAHNSNSTAANDVIIDAGKLANDIVWNASKLNDTYVGGSGSDRFLMGSQLTAADNLDGGAGIDTLVLNGNYAGGITLTSAMVRNIERIELTRGYDYKIVVEQGVVADGAKLEVVVVGDPNKPINYTVDTPSGFTGTSGVDTFTGSAVDDVFKMNANLQAFDRLDGGAGYDTVQIDGVYTAPVVLEAASAINMEELSFTSSSVFDLTLNKEFVTAGKTLVVRSTGTTRDGAATIDASAITGRIDWYGSTTADKFTGGSGSDIFYMDDKLTSADRLNGGNGSDILSLKGDYSTPLVLAANTVVNVERLNLANGYTYDLTLNANFAGSDSTPLTVAIGPSTAATTVRLDASALASNVTFDTAGHGGVFVGGSGNDLVYLTTLRATDKIDGGAGANAMTFTNRAGDVVFAEGQVRNIQTLTYFTKFHSHLTLNADMVGAGKTLEVKAQESNSGGVHDVVIDAGKLANDIVWNASSQSDVYVGGSGADRFLMGSRLTATDNLDGGAGIDTLVLNGDYSAGLTLTSDMVRNIERIELTRGFNYTIVVEKGVVPDGTKLEVVIVGDPNKPINYSVDTSAIDGFFGTANADAFVGSEIADVFHMNSNLQAFDRLDGGAGYDTVEIDGVYASPVALDAATAINMEELTYLAGSKIDLTLNAAFATAGQTLNVRSVGDATADNTDVRIDASAITGAVHWYAGGGKETLIGGSGSDLFRMGSGLSNTDVLDGGAGFDTVELTGDTSLVLATGAVRNMEQLVFSAGHTYDVTLNSDFAAAGTGIRVLQAAPSDAPTTVRVDASAVANAVTFIAGASTDTFIGGSGDDSFVVSAASISAADRFVGGDGFDTLDVTGSSSGPIVLGANAVTQMESIRFATGGTYDVTLNANFGNTDFPIFVQFAGDPSLVTSARVDGRAVETSINFRASAFDDVFLGGEGNDFFSTNADGTKTYDGGGGYNRITFGGATVGVEVDLSLVGIVQDTGFGRYALTNIQQVSGSRFDDRLFGSDEDNWFLSNGGNDVIDGGAGDDYFSIGIGIGGTITRSGVILGGTGEDTIDLTGNGGQTGGVTVDLNITTRQDTGQGRYTIRDVEDVTGTIFDDVLTGNAEDNILYGNSGADRIEGGAGHDTIYGDSFALIRTSFGYAGAQDIQSNSLGFDDILSGGDGNDRIFGNGGDDIIIGGRGADLLSGGSGADTFVYNELADSKARRPDIIIDFDEKGGDRIDLSAIDPIRRVEGDQAFHLADGGPGRAGDIFVRYDSDTNMTAIELHANNDGVADGLIYLVGEHVLTDANFVF